MKVQNSVCLVGIVLMSLMSSSFTTGERSESGGNRCQETSQESPLSQGPWIGIERVYPNLRFERPVYLTGCGDGSHRLFVVEQDGVIRVFNGVQKTEETETVRNSKVFLDIRDRISRRGNEQGLLGLAFHPDFESNGQFFVHYSLKSDAEPGEIAPNIVARFHVSSDNPDLADVNSEEVILKQSQPYTNHNGGMIEFGPDGFLYISFGDGGSANDPQGNGQNLATLLGSIVRIDVDKTDGENAYAIPGDNPFVSVDNARPENWAIGLRNVWRFSFDRKDGTLIAADVGQDRIEEVNIIEKGGNYGWNRFEANSDFNLETELAIGEHDSPVAMYERSQGISITGGYVYRGQDYPGLTGKYVYGDYVSGNLWAMSRNSDGRFHSELVRRTGRSIASFGEDDRGEIYLLSFDGGIYKIVATDHPEDTFADWPKKLSDTGLYASMEKRELSPELIAYEVNAPFWSDGATKQRYLSLPDNTKLTYRAEGSWELPVGTVLFKTFEGSHLGRVASLETRLIKRTAEGWEAATYVWDPKTNDAELLPAGKQFELYTRGRRSWKVSSWHAPSSSECASCHVDTAGYVLGINTAQLNRDVDGENQIQDWASRGLVQIPTTFDPADVARFHAPFGSEGTVEDRARVYLDVNCAMCHQPNGPGNATIDLRFSTTLTETGMVGVKPAQGDLDESNAKIISPGNPEQSILLRRIETLGAGRMPTIGSNAVDERAVELLREWIESLR